MPGTDEQSLDEYLETQLKNRKALRDEVDRLEELAKNGTLPEQSDAIRDAPLVISQAAKLQAAHDLFLLRVRAGAVTGPTDTVVAETRRLNENLAVAIARATEPR